jgi:rare lipoprotein A
MTLNDLREGDAIHMPAVAINETPPRRKMTLASLDDETLPESLQTPTITVDELHGDLVDQPTAAAQSQPEQQPVAATPTPVKVHELRGNTVPDAVVSYQPVKPTGIFVQAGSFAVQSNAENLKAKLSTLAPVQVTPVMVNGRQLFRVRLGPLASVAEADRVLAKVLAAGGDSARVIRDPK